MSVLQAISGKAYQALSDANNMKSWNLIRLKHKTGGA